MRREALPRPPRPKVQYLVVLVKLLHAVDVLGGAHVLQDAPGHAFHVAPPGGCSRSRSPGQSVGECESRGGRALASLGGRVAPLHSPGVLRLLALLVCAEALCAKAQVALQQQHTWVCKRGAAGRGGRRGEAAGRRRQRRRTTNPTQNCFFGAGALPTVFRGSQGLAKRQSTLASWPPIRKPLRMGGQTRGDAHRADFLVASFAVGVATSAWGILDNIKRRHAVQTLCEIEIADSSRKRGQSRRGWRSAVRRRRIGRRAAARVASCFSEDVTLQGSRAAIQQMAVRSG